MTITAPSGLPPSLLEHVHDALLIVDDTGSVRAMTPSARTIHGLEAAMLPLTAAQFRQRFQLRDPQSPEPPEEQSWLWARARQGEATGAVPVILHRYDDGADQPLLCSIAPLADSPGSDFLVTLEIADTADRTLAGEQRLRTIIEALPIGIWFTDTAGRIVLGNTAGQRIWAGARYVGPAEYADYKARWVETGEYIKSEEWGLARALAGETSLNEIIEIETFDNRRKIIRNAALPFRDESGRIIGALAVNEDITEQWEAGEQRERLSALVRSSTDAIVAKTRDGIITDWNPGAERMYGFTREEAIGAPISIIIPADRAGEGAWLLELVARGQVLEQFDTERIHKDGSRLSVSLSLSPIHNGLGQIVGAATISRDVAAQREAERRLHEQAEALAQADQRKDEFIATLVHELRNPLAPIATVMELIQLRDTEQRFAEPLAMLRRQVGYMTRLLDDLMDASRVARGTLRIDKQPVDLNEVMASAVEMAQSQFDEHGHALRVGAAGAAVRVLGDRQRLIQVVVNLLNNAARYTEPGGLVRASVEMEDGHALVRVSDTGAGMSADMLERAFDVFHNPGLVPADPRRGLGLGLTLVRSLVTAHGGTVTAASPGPGQGTEFVVSLPRLRDRPTVAQR